jgi:hypothetical protein
LLKFGCFFVAPMVVVVVLSLRSYYTKSAVVNVVVVVAETYKVIGHNPMLLQVLLFRSDWFCIPETLSRKVNPPT